MVLRRSPLCISPWFILSVSLIQVSFTPLSAQQIDGIWAEWTRWTDCSATCGGGGLRVRARMCQPASRYGRQTCRRPGLVSTESEECGFIECDPLHPFSTIPLGCWIIDPEDTPLQELDQKPWICAWRCYNSGFIYGTLNQALEIPDGLYKGFCYCTNDYTSIGRSIRCNSNCFDNEDRYAFQYGYLCGSSVGSQSFPHANVYQHRNKQNATLGSWSEWSFCECDTGQRYRNRTCYSSATNVTNTNCDGGLYEVGECEPSEVGDWTAWTSWSSCSLTCGGGGQQVRSRVCQGPCGGEVTQLCPFAGEIEIQELQCGLAPCVTKDPFGPGNFTSVSPLGCYNIGEYTQSYEMEAPLNNPSFCLEKCRAAEGQYGYVALDMNNANGPDYGYCYCLKGSDYYQKGPRPLSDCNATCGGEDNPYPGYMCGSENEHVGSIYTVRTNTSWINQWTAWSSCVCPSGQFRKRDCQVDWQGFGDCLPSVTNESMMEVRDCQPEPCVVCPELIALGNGKIGGDLINGFRAVKRLKCDDGYELVGSNAIQCSEQGIWQPSIPKCQKPDTGWSTWKITMATTGGFTAVLMFIVVAWYRMKKRRRAGYESCDQVPRRTFEKLPLSGKETLL